MLKRNGIPNAQYRSTKASRKQAKIILDYTAGKRKDMPGFTNERYILPRGYIKALRSKLDLTQKRLAHLLKVKLITVQSWEQEVRFPDNTAALLIELLNRQPKVKGWLEDISASPMEQRLKEKSSLREIRGLQEKMSKRARSMGIRTDEDVFEHLAKR